MTAEITSGWQGLWTRSPLILTRCAEGSSVPSCTPLLLQHVFAIMHPNQQHSSEEIKIGRLSVSKLRAMKGFLAVRKRRL
eukprot:1158739-Pelagomonas_calceolata.AAC.5